MVKLILTIISVYFLFASAHAQTLKGETLPPEPAKELRDILKDSGNKSAKVSSYERSPGQQAEVMYNVIKKHGASEAHKRYGNAGDKVIDVYEKHSNLDKKALVNKMTKEVEHQVKQLGDNRKQLMHVQPTKNHTFDVAPSSLRDKEAFRETLEKYKQQGKVDRYFTPDGAEDAYHIEIPKEIPK